MIKFLLIIQMCYQIGGTCSPPMKAKLFDSFQECSLSGYEGAYTMLKSLPIDQVNKNQTMIQFFCQPRKVENNEKKISI